MPIIKTQYMAFIMRDQSMECFTARKILLFSSAKITHLFKSSLSSGDIVKY